MNLQIIKGMDGKTEYVLLPASLYMSLREEIDKKIVKNDYVPYRADDYDDNPVFLARIKKGLEQKDLAKLMRVSQSYISQIENMKKVSLKIMSKVNEALEKKR